MSAGDRQTENPPAAEQPVPIPPPALPSSASTKRPGPRKWIVGASLLAIAGAVFIFWNPFAPESREWTPRELADKAIQNRDFRTAHDHLRTHREQHPTDLSAILLAAQVTRRSANLELAREYLRAYELAGGDKETLDLEMKLLRIQGGDFKEANTLLAHALSHPDAPETPLVLEAIVESSLNLQFPPFAMEKARVNNADVPKLASIQEAIALWSRLRPERADQVQGLVWRGRAHRITDEHAAAVADFRKALEMDPDNLHAKLALAFTLVQEAPEEATEHLEAVRNRLPDSRQLLFALATLRHGLGQLDQAREILDTILAAHPQDVASLVEKSLVDLDERQLVPAEHRLQLALRLNPNIPDVYLALSRCMLLAGRTDEAKEYQDRFLQLEAKRKKREENSTGKLPGSPRPEPEPESEIQNARNFFAALDYETFTGDLEERKKAISEALEAGTISNDAAIDGATRINSTLTQIKLVTKVATAGVAIKILTPREANETGDKLKEVTQILTKARAERSKLTSEQGYREAVAAISRIQVDLAREFYSKPDKPGDIDYAKFRAAMEMFNNFGLFAGPLQSALADMKMSKNILRGPNSASDHARWFSFSLMAIEAGVDAEFWQNMQSILLEGTEITSKILAATPPAALTDREIQELSRTYTALGNDPTRNMEKFTQLMKTYGKIIFIESPPK